MITMLRKFFHLTKKGVLTMIRILKIFFFIFSVLHFYNVQSQYNITAAIEVVTAERSESRVVFNWEIDEKSNLILDEITDQSDVRLGDTAYWSFNDDKLIPYDSKGNINEGILLIKLK